MNLGRKRIDYTSPGEQLWYELRGWAESLVEQRAENSLEFIWTDPRRRLAAFLTDVPITSICVRLVERARRECKTEEVRQSPYGRAVDDRVIASLKQFCVEPLGMSFADRRIAEFAEISLRCAKVAGEGISDSTRKECFREANPAHGVNCYACGDRVNLSQNNFKGVALDHLWPRAFGGVSDAVNLLPICAACNGAKADRITWDSYGVTHDYTSFRQGPEARRTTQLALHRRAAVRLAEHHAITLKEAFLRLGPFDDLTRIDLDDSEWFFNLTAHDTSVVAELW